MHQFTVRLYDTNTRKYVNLVVRSDTPGAAEAILEGAVRRADRQWILMEVS